MKKIAYLLPLVMSFYSCNNQSEKVNATEPKQKEVEQAKSKVTTNAPVQSELNVYIERYSYQEYIANRSHTLSGFYYTATSGIKAYYFQYDDRKPSDGDSYTTFTNSEIVPLTDFKAYQSGFSFCHRVVYFGEQPNCPNTECVDAEINDTIKAEVTIKNPCKADRKKQMEWININVPAVEQSRIAPLKEFLLKNENHNGDNKANETHNNSATKNDIKPINEAKLTLTDGSVKKANLYLGAPDKEATAFGHLTKGFMIYLNRVSDNGTIKHLVLFTRMSGDFWGSDAKIEEIYCVGDNEKVCFGIHCLTITNGQVHTNAANLKY